MAGHVLYDLIMRQSVSELQYAGSSYDQLYVPRQIDGDFVKVMPKEPLYFLLHV